MTSTNFKLYVDGRFDNLIVDTLYADVVVNPIINPTFSVNPTTGNDDNDGSTGAPFATFLHAMETLSTTNWTGDATVLISGTVNVEGRIPVGSTAGGQRIYIRGANSTATATTVTAEANNAWSPDPAFADAWTELTVDDAFGVGTLRGRAVFNITGDRWGAIYDNPGASTLDMVATIGFNAGDELEVYSAPTDALVATDTVNFEYLTRTAVIIQRLILRNSAGTSNISFGQSEFGNEGTLAVEGCRIEPKSTTSGVLRNSMSVEGCYIVSTGPEKVTNAGAGRDGLGRLFFQRCLFDNVVMEISPLSSASTRLNTNIAEVSDLWILAADSLVSSFFMSHTGGLTIEKGKTVLQNTDITANDANTGITFLQGVADLQDVHVEAGAISGIFIQSATVTSAGVLESANSGENGILLGEGAILDIRGTLIGDGNGTVGVRVNSGSTLVAPATSTISGPGGAAVDGYRIKTGAVAGWAGPAYVTGSSGEEVKIYT